MVGHHDPEYTLKVWNFNLPDYLQNENELNNTLILRYFEKPLVEDAFIDLSDGISSVADLIVSNYDGRPFSKYINGNLTINLLLDSAAVKENRRGLEEGDDLTEEIEAFIREKIREVINEVEELQRNLDKQRRINAANEKLNELSKFLSKQDLKFKLELKELKKRFSKTDNFPTTEEDDFEKNSELSNQNIYRQPLPIDPDNILVKGTWIVKNWPRWRRTKYPTNYTRIYTR